MQVDGEAIAVWRETLLSKASFSIVDNYLCFHRHSAQDEVRAYFPLDRVVETFDVVPRTHRIGYLCAFPFALIGGLLTVSLLTQPQRWWDYALGIPALLLFLALAAVMAGESYFRSGAFFIVKTDQDHDIVSIRKTAAITAQLERLSGCIRAERELLAKERPVDTELPVELGQLAHLWRQGVLTDAEYAAAKRRRIAMPDREGERG